MGSKQETPEAAGVEHGGLTLELYVEVGAHLRFFPRTQKQKVLERLGFDSDSWESSRKAWAEAIEASTQQGGSLLSLWSAAFAETCARVKGDAPALESLRPIRSLPKSDQTQLPSFMVAPHPAPVAEAPLPARVQPSSPPMSLSATIAVEPARAGVSALPFAPDAAPRAPLPIPPRSAARMSGTLDLPTPRARARKPPTMPFELRPDATGAPEPPGPPQKAPPPLTFDQYARLYAELSAFPDRQAGTWLKYGIADAETRSRLEAFWGDAFTRDPELQRRFLALAQDHYAKLPRT